MTVKEQALQQAIEIAVSHYDCFYEHGGGKLDVLSISNIQLFDCKLYPSDGMDGSNLEKCTGAAVFFVCVSIPHLHRNSQQVSQSDAAHHDDGSGCNTGGKTLLRRPGSLGFSCLYASAGILLHKLNDHRRQGDKEDDADDAKELSADHGGHKGV